MLANSRPMCIDKHTSLEHSGVNQVNEKFCNKTSLVSERVEFYFAIKNVIKISHLKYAPRHDINFTFCQLATLSNRHFFNIPYYDISLLYSRIHLKWISLCYWAKSWRQNYFQVDLTLKMTPPPYFLIRFPNRISHTFVLFKDVTLT